MRRILIDSGILLCDDPRREPLHPKVVTFLAHTSAQLITSPICIAEVLWLLGDPVDSRPLAARNHLIGAVGRGGAWRRSTSCPRTTCGSANATSATPTCLVTSPISPGLRCRAGLSPAGGG